MPLEWCTSPVAEDLTCNKDRILGGACMGTDLPALLPVWPIQAISTRVLGNGPQIQQDVFAIISDDPITKDITEDIHWHRAGPVLYGVLEIDDSQGTADTGRTPLQDATRDAYDRIFRFLADQGTPHLWKLWTYMSDINVETHGLERYRQFNIGRAEAFVAHKQVVEGNVPAACVLGTDGGPLTIAFLASSLPVIPIENPRQVSAFHYPEQYGPRKPLFARAAIARLDGRSNLFISGTASIVGHETVHIGDVRAQTYECLNNIEALLQEAKRIEGANFGFGDLAYRVYVRNSEDVSVVKEVIQERIGSSHAVYLRADVCRSDLLVEVEAHST
ncbi:chorismate transformation enzyme, FkbO/Hyg5 family [Hydrogenophaga sp. NFH-34]|uniref:chorismate transformation enzyme, FkbO/Hyg5 family n=1 Tax=Hydrogenophaga sp. NFH-34 TaxID=2744446 RepID=UPI001F2FA81F|nr:hypothetical protein [Hydrogenophaga sp. NFH-34]